VCVREADAREPSAGTMRGDGCPFVPPRREDPVILLLDFLEVAFVQPHTAGDWFAEEMILGDQVLITQRKFLVHQAREVGRSSSPSSLGPILSVSTAPFILTARMTLLVWGLPACMHEVPVAETPLRQDFPMF
jgi:hypothetical protein